MVSQNAPAWNAFAAKLSQFARLSRADILALKGLDHGEERFPAHVDIVTEGDLPRAAFVLAKGMACRYRSLPNGRRQIITFLIPGDLCDLHGFLLKRMDHSVATIVPTRLTAINYQSVNETLARHPRIAAALCWSALQDEAILRERIVTLGRRDARGRVAYLLCELVWRQMAIAASGDHAVRLPLTQRELADALGLTSIHINRVLQEFRRSNLITLEQRRLTLRDVDSLQAIAGFNQDYLHLGGVSERGKRYLAQQ
jgi:CRP-like cAMP-binding protein